MGQGKDATDGHDLARRARRTYGGGRQASRRQTAPVVRQRRKSRQRCRVSHPIMPPPPPLPAKHQPVRRPRRRGCDSDAKAPPATRRSCGSGRAWGAPCRCAPHRRRAGCARLCGEGPGEYDGRLVLRDNLI